MSYQLGAALERRRAVARQVGQALISQLWVSSVLVFGSVASGHVDEHSDVDMLTVCDPHIMPTPKRQHILEQVGREWIFDSPNQNALFAAVDADGIVEGVLVTVHYQTASWIGTVLEEVLEHGAIQTKLLPFRPYTLPSLLQRGWLLHDPRKVVEHWRQQVELYPPQLQRNLIQHFSSILAEQTEELVLSAERDLGPQGFIFHLSRAVDALVSIVYALNEIYDPADRRAERIILPVLAYTPPEFAARLRNVLEGPFTRAGTLHAAKAFKQLAEEVKTMAETTLKNRDESRS